MLAPSFQTPSWYKALTLAERMVALPQSRSLNSDFNNRIASLRLERWQTQYPFKLDGFWDQRLAQDALSAVKSIKRPIPSQYGLHRF